jgi:hypothetical protein
MLCGNVLQISAMQVNYCYRYHYSYIGHMFKTLKSHEICKRPAPMGLWWAGYLVIFSDDRTIKKVFLGKPGRRINAERPKSEIDGCQEMAGGNRGQIGMGYHSKRGMVIPYGPYADEEEEEEESCVLAVEVTLQCF